MKTLVLGLLLLLLGTQVLCDPDEPAFAILAQKRGDAFTTTHGAKTVSVQEGDAVILYVDEIDYMTARFCDVTTFSELCMTDMKSDMTRCTTQYNVSPHDAESEDKHIRFMQAFLEMMCKPPVEPPKPLCKTVIEATCRCDGGLIKEGIVLPPVPRMGTMMWEVCDLIAAKFDGENSTFVFTKDRCYFIDEMPNTLIAKTVELIDMKLALLAKSGCETKPMSEYKVEYVNNW